MSTITKEWLQQKIADMEATRDEIPFGLDEDDSNTLAGLRIALASLEAEPAAWRWEIYGGGHMYAKLKPAFLDATPLYTAPPAPVSVPDDLEMKPIQTDDGQIVGYEYLGEIYGVTAGCAWNTAIRTFRAAMLQGAEPVTTAYKLPVNTPCKEAPEHIWLQTAGVWPEDGEFSELTWCSDNQHEDDTLYVRADVVSGNSPVFRDGWVACSERMPPQGDYVSVVSRHGEYVSGLVNDEWLELHDGTSFGLDEIYLWMPLPAVPQQEVK